MREGHGLAGLHNEGEHERMGSFQGWLVIQGAKMAGPLARNMERMHCPSRMREGDLPSAQGIEVIDNNLAIDGIQQLFTDEQYKRIPWITRWTLSQLNQETLNGPFTPGGSKDVYGSVDYTMMIFAPLILVLAERRARCESQDDLLGNLSFLVQGWM
jgi:hypothetical protein